MSIGAHMKDRCTILRYVEVVEGGITEHRLETIATSQRCNFTPTSRTQADERGHTYIVTDNRLILPVSADIAPGDIVRIEGETNNLGNTVDYEAGKPNRPRRRFVSVRLRERTEQ